MAKETVKYDTTGYSILSKAVSELLNRFPGLGERIVQLEELEETSGIAFSPDSSSNVLITEKRNILDHVTQTYQFPFFVVYRTVSTRSSQKMNVQTFLDTLGDWLCGETVIIGDNEIKLEQYPDLSGGREIKKVTRGTSYSLQPTEKGVQDWLLPVIVEYTNEFDA